MVKATTIFRLSLSFLVFHLSFSDVVAQDALWATGSAIPDAEAVQLTRRPDGKFSYTGPMNAGELKIMTTAEPTDETQYLTPQLVDSYLINYGLTYVMTSDASREGWVVSFQDWYWPGWVSKLAHRHRPHWPNRVSSGSSH